MGRLKELLDEVMRETRTVQASTLRAREEVLARRRAVDAAERKISTSKPSSRRRARRRGRTISPARSTGAA
jgi:hypothetical protein